MSGRRKSKGGGGERPKRGGRNRRPKAELEAQQESCERKLRELKQRYGKTLIRNWSEEDQAKYKKNVDLCQSAIKSLKSLNSTEEEKLAADLKRIQYKSYSALQERYDDAKARRSKLKKKDKGYSRLNKIVFEAKKDMELMKKHFPNKASITTGIKYKQNATGKAMKALDDEIRNYQASKGIVVTPFPSSLESTVTRGLRLKYETDKRSQWKNQQSNRWKWFISILSDINDVKNVAYQQDWITSHEGVAHFAQFDELREKCFAHISGCRLADGKTVLQHTDKVIKAILEEDTMVVSDVHRTRGGLRWARNILQILDKMKDSSIGNIPLAKPELDLTSTNPDISIQRGMANQNENGIGNTDSIVGAGGKPSGDSTSRLTLNRTLYKCRRCKLLFWTAGDASAHEATCAEAPHVNCSVCLVLRFRTDAERLQHERLCPGARTLVMADLPMADRVLGHQRGGVTRENDVVDLAGSDDSSVEVVMTRHRAPSPVESGCPSAPGPLAGVGSDDDSFDELIISGFCT